MPKFLFQKGHIGYLKSHSNDTRKRISESLKRAIKEGRFFTKEHRKRLSENNCKHWLGVKRGRMPEEWRKNISNALQGKKASLATRKKLSVSQILYHKNNPNCSSTQFIGNFARQRTGTKHH